MRYLYAVTAGHCPIYCKPPSLGGSRTEQPESPKNLRYTVATVGSNTDKTHLDGSVFHAHCSTKSQENSKKVQNFEFFAEQNDS